MVKLIPVEEGYDPFAIDEETATKAEPVSLEGKTLIPVEEGYDPFAQPEKVTDAELIRKEGVAGYTTKNIASGVNREVLSTPGIVQDLSAGIKNKVDYLANRPLFAEKEIQVGDETKTTSPSALDLIARIGAKGINMVENFLTDKIENPIRESMGMQQADPDAPITEPVFGTKYLEDRMNEAGITVAPQTDQEAIIQRAAGGGGLGLMFGSAITRNLAKRTIDASKPSMLDSMTKSAQVAPGKTVAIETAGGTASEFGGGYAEQRYPDNPYAEMAFQVLGGTAATIAVDKELRDATIDLVRDTGKNTVKIAGKASKYTPTGYVLNKAGVKLDKSMLDTVMAKVGSKGASERVEKSKLRVELMRAAGISELSDPEDIQRFEGLVSFMDNAIATGDYNIDELKRIAPGITSLEEEAATFSPSFSERLIGKQINNREELQNELKAGFKDELGFDPDTVPVQAGDTVRNKIKSVQGGVKQYISGLYKGIDPEEKVKLKIDDLIDFSKKYDISGFSSEINSDLNSILNLEASKGVDKDVLDLIHGRTITKGVTPPSTAPLNKLLSLRSEISRQMRREIDKPVPNDELLYRLKKFKEGTESTLSTLQSVDPQAYTRWQIANDAERTYSDVFRTGNVAKILAKDPQQRFKIAPEDVVPMFVKENGKGQYQSFDDWQKVFNTEFGPNAPKMSGEEVKQAFKSYIQDDLFRSASTIDKESGKLIFDSTALTQFATNNAKTVDKLYGKGTADNMLRIAEELTNSDKELGRLTGMIDKGTITKGDTSLYTPSSIISRAYNLQRGFIGEKYAATEAAARMVFKMTDKLSVEQRQKLLEEVLTDPKAAKLLLTNAKDLTDPKVARKVQSLYRTYLINLFGQDNLDPEVIEEDTSLDSQVDGAMGFDPTALDNMMNDLQDEANESDSYEQMLNDVIKKEGGFVNNPNDRGGPTKYGITLGTLRGYRGEANYNDIKNLSEDEARQIYRDVYLKANKVDAMPNEVKHVVFDMNVNHGPKNAAKIVQTALNDMGIDVDIDGKIGDNALIGMQEVDPEALKDAILNARETFVKRIVRNDSSQKEFEEGWINRINSFRVASND